MGRFYKTSKGNYLDFIYKQPTNLLLKAQQVADQSLAQQEQAYGDLYGRLQINALTPDDKRAKNILEGYEQRIEEKAVELRSDPLKYINNPTEFRKLSNEIYKDKTRGQWAAIEANTAARTAYKEKLQKMVDAYDGKGKGISQQRMNELLGLADARFAEVYGTFGKTGDVAINAFRGDYISDYVDVFSRANTLLKDIPASTLAKANLYIDEIAGGEKGDKYVIRDKSTGKEVTESRVRGLITSLIDRDDLITNFYGSRMEAGLKGFSPQDLRNKEGTGYYDRLEDFALNKFVYKQETKDKTAAKDDYAYGRKTKAIDTYITVDGSHITTTYEGSENDNPELNGTYDAIAGNLTKNIQNLNTLKGLLKKGGELYGQLNLISDPTGLQGAIEDGIQTGDFTQALQIMEQNGISPPAAVQQLMQSHTPAQARIFKNQIAKSTQGLNKAYDDFNTLNKIISDLGILIEEPSDFTNEENKQRILDKIKDNPSVSRFYNSILNGGFKPEDVNQMATDPDLFYKKLIAAKEAIANAKAEKDKTIQTDDIRAQELDLNYDEALTFASGLLGKDAGYMSQDANKIGLVSDTKAIPDWAEITPGLEGKIEEEIKGLTHTNGKVDRDKFNTFWTKSSSGDMFKIVYNGDKRYTERIKQSREALTNAASKQQAVKAIVESLDPLTQEMETKAKAVAMMDLTGQPMDVSVSPLVTGTTDLDGSGKQRSVWIQTVTYTDNDNQKQEVTLISEIPPNKVFGPNVSVDKRASNEKNRSISYILQNSNTNIIKNKNNYGYFAEDVNVATKEFYTEDSFQPERAKLIQIWNPYAKKAEMYVVEYNFNDHLKERIDENMIELLESKNNKFTGNPTGFQSENAKKKIIEKFYK